MYEIQNGLWEPDDPTTLPNGTERLLTEQVITNLAMELAVLRLSIQQNERLLEAQRNNAAALELEIARRRFYLSLIRRLPSEVLGDIVVLLSKEDRLWREIWVFSWVCRAWRSAAMAQSSAWSRIAVGIPRRRNPVELVKAAASYVRGNDMEMISTFTSTRG